MSLLARFLYGAAGAIVLSLVVALAWVYADRADIVGERDRLQAANTELAEGAKQAKVALDAITEQAGECYTELAAAQKSAEERLNLWKQAKTVPLKEAEDEILDRQSSDAYTDSIDRILDRLRRQE